MKKPRRNRGLEKLAGSLALGRVAAAGEIPDADLDAASFLKLKMHVDNPGQTPM